MKQYKDLLLDVRDNGEFRGDRTGTGTYSKFGHQLRFDLKEGFPLLTTKFTPLRLVAVELIWFLQGNTNIKYLNDNKCHIWDEWATEEGELGPVYGKMWRSWPSENGNIDQIADLVSEIKSNPNSRRLVVSGWNPSLLPDPAIQPHENAAIGKQALPPCHTLFQFYVSSKGLSCQLYQRSLDIFLGGPFNIASYSLLTHMIADQCGLEVDEFIWSIGDAHIYSNHLDQVNELLSRDDFDLPTLELNPNVQSIFDYTPEDIVIKNYNYNPAIKAPIAV